MSDDANMKIVNTQENNDLLDKSGVTWWYGEETLTEAVVEFQSEEDMEKARTFLAEHSSNPFPK